MAGPGEGGTQARAEEHPSGDSRVLLGWLRAGGTPYPRYQPERRLHLYAGTLVPRYHHSAHSSKGPKAMGKDGATAPTASTCVPARVVRHGSDGVAVEFVFATARRRRVPDIPGCHSGSTGGKCALQRDVAPERTGPGRVRLDRSTGVSSGRERRELRRLPVRLDHRGQRGPGRSGLYEHVQRFGGSAGPATLAQITTLVTNDVSSLMNRSSLVVATCTNNTTAANGCTTCSTPRRRPILWPRWT
jgi:hypothetical protein